MLKNKEEFRIYPDGWVDPGTNRDRTGQKIDTPVTQPRSGPVRYEPIDIDGNNGYGEFETSYAAAAHARLLWPDQSQDPDRTGKGWDIQITEL